MVSTTSLNQVQLTPTPLGAPTQFNPMQSVKVANAAVLYSVTEYALFETAAALYVIATGKPDPRTTANSSKVPMRPYTAPEAKVFADGLRETMQKYPDATKAPKGFLLKLEKWKAAVYKANEPNASLQLFAGEYIKDQKLLNSLRAVQSNPKVTQAQCEEAVYYVMMARGGQSRWQYKAIDFLNKLFGGKKPDPKKPEDDNKKVATQKTEQENSAQETVQGRFKQTEFTGSELKAIKHIKMTRDFITFQKTGVISNKLEYMLRYSPRVLELMRSGTFELTTIELTALKHAKMFGSFTTYQNTGVISDTLRNALRYAPRVLKRMEMRLIK